jgi:hypothetical protein
MDDECLIKEHDPVNKAQLIRLIIGITMGGALGAVMGYFGKCASGTCPLTATPFRGAIYGAVMGALFSLTLAKQ